VCECHTSQKSRFQDDEKHDIPNLMHSLNFQQQDYSFSSCATLF